MNIRYLVLILTFTILAHAMVISAYMATSDTTEFEEGPGVARLRIYPRNIRACLRRGASCDHRPQDCCYNSSCRCNLWGTNCRCQRVGLFQKWGK